MTFLEMQQRVFDLINQDINTQDGLVTRTEVKANINRGYHKVINRIVTLAQDYYVRLAKADLVQGQSLYGLPSDFRRLIRVELGFESGDIRYRARRVDTNAYGDPVDQRVFTTSPEYSLRGKNIEIKPTPTKNVESGLHMYYIENQNDLVNDSDVPNLPFEFSDLPIEYAVAKAKVKQGLIDEGQVFLSEFYGELKEMTDNLVNTNSDDPEQVVVRDEYFD